MAEPCVVGIGSSAGGLEALQALFKALPAESGLGFVVVPHLDPTHESHLAELLGRCTRMPVLLVEGDAKVRPDHVYVLAPDQYLTMRDGILHPEKPSEPRGERRPIDAFFRSLGEDQGERAIAVILSGTGTNGSMGLRFVKAEGGVIIAQDPTTAAFSGMPNNAIATGLVDKVLAPDAIGAFLPTLSQRPLPPDAAAATEPSHGILRELDTLLALVRARTRSDFSCYRKRTLLRRVHRRMSFHKTDRLEQYIDRVRDDDKEMTALVRDLTINVSGFFRDPEAWPVLERDVIGRLVADHPANASLRIWVPGCATGEEAYSIAMLLIERMEAAAKSFEFKIFATDIADYILNTARTGLYPGSISQDVTPERLQRFFDREDDSYRIKKSLRDMITVAPQNLLQDPPFSSIDLISCRNLLIYLEPEVQKKVFALFHFALRQGGYLFLGSAESIGGLENSYEFVSKKWRIYRRIGPIRHDIVDFPLLREPVGGEGERSPEIPPTIDPQVRATEVFQRALLDKHAPASVLIDRRFAVHVFHGLTGDYLQQPGGEPTTNLLAMAREGLQGPIRAAVQRAIESNSECEVRGGVRRAGAFHPVRVIASPLRPHRGTDGYLLVSIVESEKEPERGAAREAAVATPQQDLEEELNAAREDLRLTIEQMETSNEELKASYEEIRSINEELQASNEELETSKEELQSLNEELRTVNNQLRSKVQELETRTDDLDNLLNGTNVATLFLDEQLRIRWFTPAMKELLELLPGDIGRPVYHFAARCTGGKLVEDAREVLRSLVPTESELPCGDGHWFIRRIVPYRTVDNRIDGVVVTFTDITERKKAQIEVEAARAYAESIVDTVREPLLVLTDDLTVTSANDSFYRVFQVSRGDTAGRKIYELGNGQWDIPEFRRLLDEILPTNDAFEDFEVEQDFESIGHRVMLLNARRLDDMQLILLAIEDITPRKRVEQERERLTGEMQHRVKNLLAMVQALASQTDVADRSAESYREAFLGRLRALTRVHTLLERDGAHDGTDLIELTETVIDAYRGEHPETIEAAGVPVGLSVRQAVSVGMVLHELCANASKYGALSNHEGGVRVSWEIISDDSSSRLRLRWQERGGPPPDPSPAGGARLIRGMCEHNLRGSATLDYLPEGLRCEIVFPLREEANPAAK